MGIGKKFIQVLLLVTLLTGGCQPQTEDRQTEEKKLKDLIHELFQVIDNHDYQALRDLCTEDFVLFEAGKMMNMEETIQFLSPFKGQGDVKRTLEDMHVHAHGTAAWVRLRHKALRTWNGHKRDIDWFESAGFRKEHGVWKIAFYHNSIISVMEL